MWIVALMAALMLGTALGFETSTEEPETDTADASPTDDEDTLPVATLPDAIDEDTPEPDPIPAVETGETFELLRGQSATGTDGDDRFVLIDGDRAPFDGNALAISGGAGNDTFDLLNPTGETDDLNSSFLVYSALIEGGAGNDTINVAAPDSTVSGGEGDDRINVVVATNTLITGDAGDDYIFGDQVDDPVTIQGGTGNDTIDATDMRNVAASGGDGNDQIMITGQDLLGTGYSTYAFGGAGDDTISLEGEAFRSDSRFIPIGMQGDAGADVFELTFNEGRSIQVPLNATPPASVFVAELLDFEPGVDTIVIEPEIMNAAFAITEASLVEDVDAGTTDLIISYQSETEIDRNVIIVINAVGVSFDDISFVGFDEATLTGSRSTS